MDYYWWVNNKSVLEIEDIVGLSKNDKSIKKVYNKQWKKNSEKDVVLK